MTFLVCGDRGWTDQLKLAETLDALCAEFPEWHFLIEGGAKGADTLARKWGETCPAMRVVECPALWDDCFCGHRKEDHGRTTEGGSVRDQCVAGCKCEHFRRQGKAAGMIRNQHMLDKYKPDMVIFFHRDLTASKGTKDMVERARAAGVPVLNGLTGDVT